MDKYEEVLITKNEELRNSKSPFAKMRLVHLLKQFGELQNKE